MTRENHCSRCAGEGKRRPAAACVGCVIELKQSAREKALSEVEMILDELKSKTWETHIGSRVVLWSEVEILKEKIRSLKSKKEVA